MTVIHEIAHFLDFAGLPGEGFSSKSPKKKFRRVMRAIRKTAEVKAIRAIFGTDEHYLLKPVELFARAYSEYIIRRSGDPVLLSQLKTITLNATAAGAYRQWSEESFRPIEAAFDRLFRGLGWLSGS